MYFVNIVLSLSCEFLMLSVNILQRFCQILVILYLCMWATWDRLRCNVGNLGLSGTWDKVYNRGLWTVGDLGLSGVLISGGLYRERVIGYLASGQSG